MNSAVTKEDKLSVAVVDVLERTSGNSLEATKELAKRVRADKALYAAVLDPLIEYACAQVVNKAIQRHRDRVWTPPKSFGSDQSSRIAALAADNLLLFPLPGGLALGDASRVEVSAAQDFYGKQAKDMAHKSRWLELVAQSLSDGKTVRDVLSAERLRELQKEAQDA